MKLAYTCAAVAGNASSRELATALTKKCAKTLDWTKKSVCARLLVAVKRTLRLYGYLSDMQVLATETVLQQAEMIAGDFV